MKIGRVGIIAPNRNLSNFIKLLGSHDSDLDISVWPQIDSPETIEFILTWNPPPNCFEKFSNLKFCCSLGAGVDELVYREDIKEDVLIGRIIDEKLSSSLARYCMMCALMIENNMDVHLANMQIPEWEWMTPRKQLKIGVLGLGEIGLTIANRLQSLGYTVSGFSRTQKEIDGIKTYSGDEQLPGFLSTLDVLISVLPLTKESSGILNNELFTFCKDGLVLVNVGRGQHLNENDLLKALNSGKIRNAILDVFSEEPLPQDHPFWKHRKIITTPHVAGITDQKSAADQFYKSISQISKGSNPEFLVDRSRGY